LFKRTFFSFFFNVELLMSKVVCLIFLLFSLTSVIFAGILEDLGMDFRAQSAIIRTQTWSNTVSSEFNMWNKMKNIFRTDTCINFFLVFKFEFSQNLGMLSICFKLLTCLLCRAAKTASLSSASSLALLASASSSLGARSKLAHRTNNYVEQPNKNYTLISLIFFSQLSRCFFVFFFLFGFRI
jgi:hypothetical protein